MKQSTLTITFLALAVALWALVFVGFNKARGAGRDAGKTSGHILQSSR